MSSGSYFRLYRKYDIKASDAIYDELCEKYIDYYNISHGFKKWQYADLPTVLKFDVEGMPIAVHDVTIESAQAKYEAVLKSSHEYADELITWDFCSDFKCIENMFLEMSRDMPCSATREISKSEAKQILQACNYLLSGKWSDEFEAILDNEFI